jgi:hypothetical protein
LSLRLAESPGIPEVWILFESSVGFKRRLSLRLAELFLFKRGSDTYQHALAGAVVKLVPNVACSVVTPVKVTKAGGSCS